MLTLILSLSRFVYIALMLIFILGAFYSFRRLPSRRRTWEMANYQYFTVAVFFLLGAGTILLETLRNEGDAANCALYLALTGGGLLVMHILTITVHKGTSRLLWNGIWMLLVVGLTMLWRLRSSVAVRQVRWLLFCLVLVNVILAVMRKNWIYRIPSSVFAAFCGLLIVLPFLFPYQSGGALNWVDIHGFTFQPSEFVKISYVFFLAFLYAKKRSFRRFAFAACVTGFLALVLLKQNDLGGLLLFGLLFWLLTYEYIGNAAILWGGLFLAAAAAYAAFRLVPHVRVRVEAWLNPWADIFDGGYQIAHSLFAITGGGWFGSGLYKGLPTYIPVNTTDMIFSAIAEEFGGIFVSLLIILYGTLAVTVLKYAEHEKQAQKRTLLLGFGILFMAQTFINIGGAIKLIPLTGVTLPFISYGGSSMISTFVSMAVVQGIIRSTYPPEIKENEEEEEDETQEDDEYEEYDEYEEFDDYEEDDGDGWNDEDDRDSWDDEDDRGGRNDRDGRNDEYDRNGRNDRNGGYGNHGGGGGKKDPQKPEDAIDTPFDF